MCGVLDEGVVKGPASPCENMATKLDHIFFLLTDLEGLDSGIPSRTILEETFR